jgi:hypothetical protein
VQGLFRYFAAERMVSTSGPTMFQMTTAAAEPIIK